MASIKSEKKIQPTNPTVTQFQSGLAQRFGVGISKLVRLVIFRQQFSVAVGHVLQ